VSAAIEVEVAGTPVQLLAERAVFWPAAGLLAVADLHWGKAETFHRFGVPVPAGVLADDLARLGRALARSGATHLVVLGDLLHGPAALVEGVVAEVTAWRHQWPVAMTLATGNHDRTQGAPLPLPPAWGIEAVEAVRAGPFCFRHEPVAEAGAYVWCGHLHPMVGLGRGVRLPCFHLGTTVGVLPAFSAFTGGVGVRQRPGERCFGVAGGRVVAVPGRAE